MTFTIVDRSKSSSRLEMNHSNDSSRDGEDGFCLKRKTCSRGVAEIKNSVQKVRRWLGTFDTAEEAAPTSARTNFEFPEEFSRASYDLEPFSFEEACGGIEEEADSLVGALQAKLSSANTNQHSVSSALHLSLYGSSHFLPTRNKDTRAAPSQQPPPPPPLKSSNSNGVNHQNQNNSATGKIHNLITHGHRNQEDQEGGQQLPWGSRISYEDSSSTITTKSWS